MKKDEISQLRTKSIKGLSLLVAREFVIKIIAAVGQLFLVRLLSPQFFGVFAILTFLINVADLFTDLGLVTGIIREKKNIDDDVLSIIFTVKFVCSLVAVVVLNILGPILLQNFLHDQTFLWAFRLITLTLLLRPYKTMTYGLLERELRYESIPTVDVVGLLVYFAVGIGGAMLHLGVGSLLAATVIKDVAEVALLFHIKPWFPRLRFEFAKIRCLIHFGAPLQLATIIGFIHQSSVPLLGGLLSTPSAVGILDTSSNIASLPRALTDNVGRVAFASFSRIQDETEVLSRASQRAISILTLPLFLLLNMTLALGPILVNVVLTPKWHDILVPLHWYLLAGIFLSCIAVLQQALIARGETVWLLKLSTLTVIGEWVVAITLFQYVGFVSFPIASAMSAGFLFFEYAYLGAKKGIHVHLLSSLFPSLCIFLLVEGANIVISQLQISSLEMLGIKALITPLLFFVLALFLAKSSVQWMISLVREFIFHDIINEN